MIDNSQEITNFAASNAGEGHIEAFPWSDRTRSDARVAEEARLESVCAPKAYRGFESRLLRKRNDVLNGNPA